MINSLSVGKICVYFLLSTVANNSNHSTNVMLLMYGEKCLWGNCSRSFVFRFHMAKNSQLTLDRIKEIVPVLTNDLHKGQCGRIGIIGGCEE